MRVPTVRVVNPADPSSFMTINKTDLAEHHEMWPDQARDFDAVTDAPMDPGERDLAASLMQRMLAERHDFQISDYRALPVAERMAHLRDAEEGFTQAVAARAEDRRIEAEAAERGEASSLRVAKGPRGLFFVMRGEERLGTGHQTEADAETARAQMEAA